MHVQDAPFLQGILRQPFRHVGRFPVFFRQAHQQGLVGGFEPGFILGALEFAAGVENDAAQAAGRVVVKIQGKGLAAHGLLGLEHAVQPGAPQQGVRRRPFNPLALPQRFQHLVLIHSRLQILIKGGKEMRARERKNTDDTG